MNHMVHHRMNGMSSFNAKFTLQQGIQKQVNRRACIYIYFLFVILKLVFSKRRVACVCMYLYEMEHFGCLWRTPLQNPWSFYRKSTTLDTFFLLHNYKNTHIPLLILVCKRAISLTSITHQLIFFALPQTTKTQPKPCLASPIAWRSAYRW